MLLKISIYLFIAAILLLLIYLLSIKRKKRGFLSKLSGTLSIALFICCSVLIIIHCKSNNIKIFNRVKNYDIVKTYTDTLAKSDATGAYPLLPTNVFTQNDKVFFTNGKNDLFEIVNTEGVYTFPTISNSTTFTNGAKTLNAVIDTNGNLILDGYLLYSKYESKIVKFSNKTIAKNVKSVSFTSNSLFYITNDAKLYAMGFNESAQLGDTTTKPKSEPILIMENVKSADISDTHSMIVDIHGTLYAVGDNSYSQLGNKTAVSSNELTRIMQGVKDAKVGNYYSMVLTVNGELYTAGINEKGQLGNGGEEFKAELIKVLDNVYKIETQGDTCAALTYNGELYVWGDNNENKAGVNDSKSITKPNKLHDNAYDFALSTNSVVILTKERDIILTDKQAQQNKVLKFNATVPEEFKEYQIVTTK